MATALKSPTRTIGPGDAGRAVTADEYREAEFAEGFRYERVRGRLVVMAPAGNEHTCTSRPFRRLLGGYWGDHPDRVDDVDVKGWLATSPDDDRLPDICVYLAGESSEIRIPERVPELIFEFVSGNRADQERDYIHKRAEYHAVGVREYVIVDRFKQQALVLTWNRDDYAEHVLDATDEYTTPLLPGLKVGLEEAFR